MTRRLAHSPRERAVRLAGAAVTVLALALAPAACASREAADMPAGAGGVPDTAPRVNAGLGDTVPLVALERAPCFGSCPVYRVVVRGDGVVRFDGRRFVADSGAHEARIPADSVRALLAAFDATPFATADSAYVDGPECGAVMTDAPSLTLTRWTDGAPRTVHLYQGCSGAPRWIADLARTVDWFAGTDRWITASGATP